MAKRCPKCKGDNTRPSRQNKKNPSIARTFFPLQRCRDCGNIFSTVSLALPAAVIAITALLTVPPIALKASGALSGVSLGGSAAREEFDALQQKAALGDMIAQRKLGMMYLRGFGVEKDQVKAAEHLTVAAKGGDGEAQYQLAMSLRSGLFTLQNFGAATNWMEQAAERGHPRAWYEMGLSYYHGQGVPNDFSKAYVYFSMAAVKNVEAAAKMRDAALGRLAPSEVASAQAEALKLAGRWATAQAVASMAQPPAQTTQ